MEMICLRTGEPATADIVEKYCVEVGVEEHSGGVSNGVVDLLTNEQERQPLLILLRGSHLQMNTTACDSQDHP